MDVCIKNINDESWRMFKSESVKHDMRVGEFFSILVEEHKERCNKSTLKDLLFSKKTLTEKDAKNIKESMREFRKGFKF